MALKTEGTSQTFGQRIIKRTDAGFDVDAPTTTTESDNLPPEPQIGTLGIIVKTIEDVETPVSLQSRDSTRKLLSTNTNNDGITETLKVGTNINVALAAVSEGKSVAMVEPTKTIKDSGGGFNPEISPTSVNPGVTNVVQTVEDDVLVLGSEVNSPTAIKKALEESGKIDFATTLRSRSSESLHANLIKTPNLKGALVYNFFEKDEENIEISEDQSKDPLLTKSAFDTPRYVDLRWDISQVSNPIKGTEEVIKQNKAIRKNVFYDKRGVAGVESTRFKNSVESSAKKFSPILTDGVKKKVVDVHELERAFDSIANRQKFPNALVTTVDTENTSETISKIPYLKINKV